MLFYLYSSLGFIAAIMLQMGVFSRAALFSGTADVVLLFWLPGACANNKNIVGCLW